MLIIFHVAAEAPSKDYPHDPGPVPTAKESMTAVVKNLLAKFGPPTEIFISPYNISLQTYRVIKPLFDVHKLRPASREPRLSKFISSRIPAAKLMPKTLEGKAGDYLEETEETFKRRVQECYKLYFQKAAAPGANIWLLTHSDVMNEMAILANCKFDRPVDYHAFLGIPPKGDILTGDMHTRTSPAVAQTSIEPDISMPVVSIAGSSTQHQFQIQPSRPPPSRPQPQPQPAPPISSRPPAQPRTSKRELAKIKQRKRRERRIMKNAVVSYPKGSGFRFQESSSSSSDSESGSYSNSSDSSEEDVITQRPVDIFNSRMGASYQVPSSRHMHTKPPSRSTVRPIVDINEFEPPAVRGDQIPSKRKVGRDQRAGRDDRIWFDLSKFGRGNDDEFLREGDLESIR